MGKLHKDLRPLVDQAIKQGFSLTEKRKGWQILDANGNPCAMIHGTPSKWAAVNLRRDLQKAGLKK